MELAGIAGRVTLSSLIPVLVTGIQCAVSTARKTLLRSCLGKRSLAVQTHGGWIPVTDPRIKSEDRDEGGKVSDAHQTRDKIRHAHLHPTRKTGINSPTPLNKINHL